MYQVAGFSQFASAAYKVATLAEFDGEVTITTVHGDVVMSSGQTTTDPDGDVLVCAGREPGGYVYAADIVSIAGDRS